LISESVNIPVIASGGAGNPEDIAEVLSKGKADAALAASIFHYGKYSINDVRNCLIKNKIPVRK
jgi:cyclase